MRKQWQSNDSSAESSLGRAKSPSTPGPSDGNSQMAGTPPTPQSEAAALRELAEAIARLTERLAEVEANVVLVFKNTAALRATVGTPVGRHASGSDVEPAPTVHQLLVRFAKRLDTNEAHVTDLLHIAEEALEGLDLSDLIGATSDGGVEPDKSEDDVPFMDEVRYDERPLDVD